MVKCTRYIAGDRMTKIDNKCDFEPYGAGWRCRLCGWLDIPHPHYPRSEPTNKNCPAKQPSVDHPLVAPTPEQIAQAEADRTRHETAALEAGAKLGWKPKHALRWATALLRWRSVGYPTRSDTEVAECMATCEACDRYVAAEGRCSVCGCRVSTSGMAAVNKARMGSESCPEGKW